MSLPLIMLGCLVAAALFWMIVVLGILLWHLRPLGWVLLIGLVLALSL